MDHPRPTRLSRRAAVKTGAAGIALATLGAATIGSSFAQDATPAAGAAPDVVLQYFDAYQNADVEAALALFTDDAVFQHEGYGIEISGLDQLRSLHASLFESNQNIVISNVSGLQSGDKVAAEATWAATNVNDAPGGNPGPDDVTFKFALFGDLTDGKFSRVAVYYDSLREQVQTGVLEPIAPGTPAASS